jgi:hypothetical protein
LRNDSADTLRPWMQYRERLDTIRKDTHSRGPGMTSGLQGTLELVSVLEPEHQPSWGRLTMAIFMAAKQILPGDGHARAARREEAWYPF